LDEAAEVVLFERGKHVSFGGYTTWLAMSEAGIV
jgi:hypothetical protein